jgi:CheY-like chemotaxis protein
MSKIEAGQATCTITNFDLYDLLLILEQMFRSQAEQKGLQLLCNRAPNLPRYVQTDEGKLRQILINLLNNAIKFTSQGRVTLWVGMEAWQPRTVEGQKGQAVGNASVHPSVCLCFEITDTGSGIAPDELESLFEPFVQSKHSKTYQEGTGLGLPISQQFVRLLGGDLTVDSRLGHGATFRFKIPVTLTAMLIAEQPRQRRAIALAPNQPTYRILIVENDWASRHLLFNLLQKFRFEIQQATNGEEAVQIWQSWRPHVIWMDIRMPIMDGYAATKQIRAMEAASSAHSSLSLQATEPQNAEQRATPIATTKAQSTKIIALTANAFAENQVQALAAGCDDFVAKPLQTQTILEKISQHLGVQYIYDTDKHLVSMLDETVPQTVPLTFQALQVMPTDWLRQLYQITTQLDSERFLLLLEQIPEQHVALTQALQEKLNNFDYEQILHLIEQALAETKDTTR